jgi:hypothetical protein
MEDWKLPWTGGCRCGRVRFEVTAPPLLAQACHCAGCQKMSASAFSLTLSLPGDGLRVTQGEPALGGTQDPPQHWFCPFCKTWMFTRPPDLPWLANLRPTLLDDHAWFVPFVEYFTAEKLPWAVTGARHAFEKVPQMADFEPLVAEYARDARRPG